MLKNIIFDFGAVLVDWNPRHLFEPYFNDKARTDYFLETVCPYEWNTTVDAGRPIADAVQECLELFPEWEKEIRMYFGEWIKMMGGEIPGMEEYVRELKSRGFKVYGLTNWSAETFPLIRGKYPVFSLLDGYVVSGEEHTKKPLPQIYRCLLERFSLDPGESIFIDDNPDNVAGAEAVGIRGLLFTSPENLKKELEPMLR